MSSQIPPPSSQNDNCIIIILNISEHLHLHIPLLGILQLRIGAEVEFQKHSTEETPGSDSHGEVTMGRKAPVKEKVC